MSVADQRGARRRQKARYKGASFRDVHKIVELERVAAARFAKAKGKKK